MCSKHMYQRLLWVNTSHLMFSLSACPHRQFDTLLGLLDSQASLPNSYPNALRAMQGGSLYHFSYIRPLGAAGPLAVDIYVFTTSKVRFLRNYFLH